jgi:predicted Zn-dependent protease
MSRIGNAITGAAQVVGSLLFLACMCLVFAANCFGVFDRPIEGDFGELPIVEPDYQDSSHIAVISALVAACDATGLDGCLQDVVIAQSGDLNAASFGEGRYIFWSGAASLPRQLLEGMAAHEVAHDVLLHSRRAQDASAFVAFLAEVVSTVGGAHPDDENRIRGWLESATMPRYSRKHELEADSLAVVILARMGYPEPEEPIADVLSALMARYGDSGGGFLDSHPATSERLARLRNRAER